MINKKKTRWDVPINPAVLHAEGKILLETAGAVFLQAYRRRYSNESAALSRREQEEDSVL